jgi:hypothetical protein
LVEDALRQVYRAARERPYVPAHLRVLLTDAARLPYLTSREPHKFAAPVTPASTAAHLDATMEWLCRAQDATPDRGVSTAYSLRDGWLASYPETTGYIVNTFFDHAEAGGGASYRARAVEMADWLLSIQMESGAFQGGPIDLPPEPSVFNTGQILLGLARVYRETEDPRYLTAACSAADWLSSVQEPDGAWRRHAYKGIAHAYYTRVAWAMLEVGAAAGDGRWEAPARAQLDWALARQHEDGWCEENSFEPESDPYTHNIAYVAEGFLGAGVLLGDERYVEAARRVALPLFRKFEVEKFLPGQLGPGWTSAVRYSCLTGNAQLAALWMRLFELDGDVRHLNAALKLNEYVKSTQWLDAPNPGVRGGVKGSDPVWGAYLPFSYPNWAAKFHADSLLLEERVVARLSGAAA